MTLLDLKMKHPLTVSLMAALIGITMLLLAVWTKTPDSVLPEKGEPRTSANAGSGSAGTTAPGTVARALPARGAVAPARRDSRRDGTIDDRAAAADALVTPLEEARLRAYELVARDGELRELLDARERDRAEGIALSAATPDDTERRRLIAESTARTSARERALLGDERYERMRQALTEALLEGP